MRRAGWLLLAAGIVVLGFWSAEPGVGQEKQKDKGTLVKLDGLESRTPADWYEEKSDNPMRLKQFRLSPIGNDRGNVEVVISSFGEAKRGSAEDIIKRWKGLFVPPEGKTIEDVSVVQKFKVSGVPVTYLDTHGSYSVFPRSDPRAKNAIRPNFRLLGAVFESKKGPYLIHMLGPANTVAYDKKDFDEFLKGFK
jgi:hypothetical protein